MTLDEAVHHVTTTNPAFAVTTATIRGTDYRVFQNAPPSVAALLRGSWEAHGNGALEYIVYEGESWSFAEYCDEVKALASSLRSELGVR